VIWMLLALVPCAGPADHVTRAAADVVTQPEHVRQYLRYFSTYAVREKHLKTYKQIFDFHVNTLSREAFLQPSVEVAPGLFRVDITHYGWNPKVLEKLAAVDPFYHLTADVEEKVDEQRYHPGGEINGTYYAPGTYTFRDTKKVKKTGAGILLDPASVATLVKECQTQIPIMRADWFINQTAIQEGREVGYYGMLELGKSQDDFDALVGLDEKLAKKIKREVKGIVARSSVTHHNRVINRYGGASGGVWITYDYINSEKKRNIIRNLDKDVDPEDGDAAESYGFLPNGLFAFFLSNGAGRVRQNTAPDTIASDARATGTDRRVHIGMSCIRCHIEGLRPVNDWMRAVYKDRLALGTTDKDKENRFRQLYLSNLEIWLKQDIDLYTHNLYQLTRMKVSEVATGYGQVWDAYQETDLELADVARETGYDEKFIVEALTAYATPKKGLPPLDPVLAGLIATPPQRIRRDHFDESFGLLSIVLKGYKK
jgi:hypothetical protein